MASQLLTGTLILTEGRASRWLAMLCAQLSRRIESPLKFKAIGIEVTGEGLMLALSWRSVAVRLYFEPLGAQRYDFIRAVGVDNKAFAYGKRSSYEDRADARMQAVNGADMIEAVLDYYLSYLNVLPGPARKRPKPAPDKYFVGEGLTIAYPARFANFKEYYTDLKLTIDELRLKRPAHAKRYETDIARAEQALGLRMTAMTTIKATELHAAISLTAKLVITDGKYEKWQELFEKELKTASGKTFTLEWFDPVAKEHMIQVKQGGKACVIVFRESSRNYLFHRLTDNRNKTLAVGEGFLDNSASDSVIKNGKDLIQAILEFYGLASALPKEESNSEPSLMDIAKDLGMPPGFKDQAKLLTSISKDMGITEEARRGREFSSVTWGKEVIENLKSAGWSIKPMKVTASHAARALKGVTLEGKQVNVSVDVTWFPVDPKTAKRGNGIPRAHTFIYILFKDEGTGKIITSQLKASKL